ncbi:hypothetical protein M0811_10008 [Anaeramoeba ignava]|uniref:Uncharacterized protein n=1 Tax=Anaeramoeba ignava TaxID=1746090 RepID=A0A9Q0R9W3_ANAIG|nr:hypothetical protein M0811_10008 [Anaeramoeba ignava]
MVARACIPSTFDILLIITLFPTQFPGWFGVLAVLLPAFGIVSPAGFAGENSPRVILRTIVEDKNILES